MQCGYFRRPTHCFQSFTHHNANSSFDAHSLNSPRRFCRKKKTFNGSLFEDTETLTWISCNTSPFSVSIICLVQMIRCSQTRTDADLEWLIHKVTKMKELIGLAIMFCVKWAAYSLWHWSIRILIKLASDSQTHHSDRCFMGLTFTLSACITVDSSDLFT